MGTIVHCGLQGLILLVTLGLADGTLFDILMSGNTRGPSRCLGFPTDCNSTAPPHFKFFGNTLHEICSQFVSLLLAKKTLMVIFGAQFV
jgi:hypothetical protein